MFIVRQHFTSTNEPGEHNINVRARESDIIEEFLVQNVPCNDNYVQLWLNAWLGAVSRRSDVAPLAFTVVVREAPERRFEVGRSLLLDLVGERVDLEPV